MDGPTEIIKKKDSKMKIFCLVISLVWISNTSLAAGSQNTCYEIKGMVCHGCANNIKASLKKMKGVKDAEVSYPNSYASVSYDPTLTKPEDIQKTITALDFKAKPKECSVANKG